MSGPAAHWEDYCEQFQKFQKAFQKSRAVNINSNAIKNQLKAAVQSYFRAARPELLSLTLSEEDIAELDAALQELLRLAAGNNLAGSYRKWMKIARNAGIGLSGKVEGKLGNLSVGRPQRTSAENAIAETLRAMIPSAASSYQQALVDLEDTSRTSFRGPAAELREALRDVLDHLAPDKQVEVQPGFKLEKDRNKPTMRQKVRFILKARGEGRSASEAPENAANLIEHGIGELTRSVYTLGALNTHISAGRREVIQLKRYFEAVLMDILAIE